MLHKIKPFQVNITKKSRWLLRSFISPIVIDDCNHGLDIYCYDCVCMQAQGMSELTENLKQHGVVLSIEYSSSLHDRQIK